MMSSNPEIKENFKFLTKHGIRAQGQIFISNEANLNQLVNYVPEGVLTGFHLKDIFDTANKYSEI